jgi:hypothetical protein
LPRDGPRSVVAADPECSDDAWMTVDDRRETPRWRKLYSGRAAVERQFGRLKNKWALLLRVRGRDRVALHADLTILATLACALARARAAPLAA